MAQNHLCTRWAACILLHDLCIVGGCYWAWQVASHCALSVGGHRSTWKAAMPHPMNVSCAVWRLRQVRSCVPASPPVCPSASIKKDASPNGRISFLLWRQDDALPGVAEHPASPNGDTRSAHQPLCVARFLLIHLNSCMKLCINALWGLEGPSKPRTVESQNSPAPPLSLSSHLPTASA